MSGQLVFTELELWQRGELELDRYVYWTSDDEEFYELDPAGDPFCTIPSTWQASAIVL